MAEDLAELGMEAVGPITDHHDKVDESLLASPSTLCPLTRQSSGLAKGKEHGQEWLQRSFTPGSSSVQR